MSLDHSPLALASRCLIIAIAIVAVLTAWAHGHWIGMTSLGALYGVLFLLQIRAASRGLGVDQFYRKGPRRWLVMLVEFAALLFGMAVMVISSWAALP